MNNRRSDLILSETYLMCTYTFRANELEYEQSYLLVVEDCADFP
jgi:hypothetical protein